jgi:polysaccharide biosynthesis/export protein
MDNILLTRFPLDLIRRTLPFFVAVAGLSSCVKHREMISLNEGREFPTSPTAIANQAVIRVQPGDLLAISIQTIDPTVSAPFNPGSTEPRGTGNEANASTAQSTGGGTTYLVDANGEINMPLLGKVRIDKLTTLQVRDSIGLKLGKYLTAPIVNVRLLNFKITVLGEVGRSGTFQIDNERVNILQALGLAGDFTTYGNREKVLVIREKEGQREFGQLNLHDRAVFESPYFYLQPNDVVYVEATHSKVGATQDQATKYLQWALPIVTVISVFVSLLR